MLSAVTKNTISKLIVAAAQKKGFVSLKTEEEIIKSLCMTA